MGFDRTGLNLWGGGKEGKDESGSLFTTKTQTAVIKMANVLTLWGLLLNSIRPEAHTVKLKWTRVSAKCYTQNLMSITN